MNEAAKKSILNAGAGSRQFALLPGIFSPAEWTEVRLDIDPYTAPDIVGSFANMHGTVEDGRFDAVYSSHAIEHLHGHEVTPAFGEFRRVLKPDGFALVTCPNLVAVAKFLLSRGADEIAYESMAGPIRPIDMIYGHGESIAAGRFAMAHHTGFTPTRLANLAIAAGFSEVRVMEGDNFDIWAALMTPMTSHDQVAALFRGTILTRLFDASAQRAAPAPPVA